MYPVSRYRGPGNLDRGDTTVPEVGGIYLQVRDFGRGYRAVRYFVSGDGVWRDASASIALIAIFGVVTAPVQYFRLLNGFNDKFLYR